MWLSETFSYRGTRLLLLREPLRTNSFILRFLVNSQVRKVEAAAGVFWSIIFERPGIFLLWIGDSVKCSRVDLAGRSCLTGAHQRQATLAQQRTSAWLMSPGRESYWSESLKPVERSHRWGEGWSPAVRALQGVFQNLFHWDAFGFGKGSNVTIWVAWFSALASLAQVNSWDHLLFFVSAQIRFKLWVFILILVYVCIPSNLEQKTNCSLQWKLHHYWN